MSDLIRVYQINQLYCSFRKERKKACIFLKHECSMSSYRIIFTVSPNGLILWTDGFRKRKKKTFYQPFRLDNFFSEASLLSRKAISGMTVALFQKLQDILSVLRPIFFSCHLADPYQSMVSMSMPVIRKCKFTNNLSSVNRNGLLAWYIN